MTISGVINNFVTLVNDLVALLSTAALLLFMWGAVRFIWESGDAKAHGNGREAMQWGFISLFVLFSIWGIINLFKQMVFG